MKDWVGLGGWLRNETVYLPDVEQLHSSRPTRFTATPNRQPLMVHIRLVQLQLVNFVLVSCPSLRHNYSLWRSKSWSGSIYHCLIYHSLNDVDAPVTSWCCHGTSLGTQAWTGHCAVAQAPPFDEHRRHLPLQHFLIIMVTIFQLTVSIIGNYLIMGNITGNITGNYQ